VAKNPDKYPKRKLTKFPSNTGSIFYPPNLLPKPTLQGISLPIYGIAHWLGFPVLTHF